MIFLDFPSHLSYDHFTCNNITHRNRILCYELHRFRNFHHFGLRIPVTSNKPVLPPLNNKKLAYEVMSMLHMEFYKGCY